jgi:hypothetical protein
MSHHGSPRKNSKEQKSRGKFQLTVKKYWDKISYGLGTDDINEIVLNDMKIIVKKLGLSPPSLYMSDFPPPLSPDSLFASWKGIIRNNVTNTKQPWGFLEKYFDEELTHEEFDPTSEGENDADDEQLEGLVKEKSPDGQEEIIKKVMSSMLPALLAQLKKSSTDAKKSPGEKKNKRRSSKIEEASSLLYSGSDEDRIVPVPKPSKISSATKKKTNEKVLKKSKVVSPSHKKRRTVESSDPEESSSEVTKNSSDESDSEVVEEDEETQPEASEDDAPRSQKSKKRMEKEADAFEEKKNKKMKKDAHISATPKEVRSPVICVKVIGGENSIVGKAILSVLGTMDTSVFRFPILSRRYAALTESGLFENASISEMQQNAKKRAPFGFMEYKDHQKKLVAQLVAIAVAISDEQNVIPIGTIIFIISADTKKIGTWTSKTLVENTDNDPISIHLTGKGQDTGHMYTNSRANERAEQAKNAQSRGGRGGDRGNGGRGGGQWQQQQQHQHYHGGFNNRGGFQSRGGFNHPRGGAGNHDFSRPVQIMCGRCGIVGHKFDRCFNKNGHPDFDPANPMKLLHDGTFKRNPANQTQTVPGANGGGGSANAPVVVP